MANPCYYVLVAFKVWDGDCSGLPKEARLKAGLEMMKKDCRVYPYKVGQFDRIDGKAFLRKSKPAKPSSRGKWQTVTDPVEIAKAMKAIARDGALQRMLRAARAPFDRDITKRASETESTGSST